LRGKKGSRKMEGEGKKINAGPSGKRQCARKLKRKGVGHLLIIEELGGFSRRGEKKAQRHMEGEVSEKDVLKMVRSVFPRLIITIETPTEQILP